MWWVHAQQHQSEFVCGEREMGVIREAWVEKSSGGKKDGATGAMVSGKENWKRRYVVVEDSPVPTLSWYKTDKVRRASFRSKSRPKPHGSCLLRPRLDLHAFCRLLYRASRHKAKSNL